eukprot:NODE_20826_length_780_cov_8.033691.p1 GENE.NODE_20826_length_780_cov_8.033691~~NODE_20826_length_780_cov_8.033691.p1  ORF type:complete len:168 (-),score=17.42 NODE_20826_length_780_cov_8.033691:96-599(-)
MPTFAAPLGAEGSDDEEDDDWRPTAQPGVVLRPNLLSWEPRGGTRMACRFESDPLHSPDADREDEQWVCQELLHPDTQQCHATDAVLNCPGCFMPVCYQCQRHEHHARQWRAAEVRNCVVDRSTSLKLGVEDATAYHAVRCEACSADVGLVDVEGVYHLFHVLESQT